MLTFHNFLERFAFLLYRLSALSVLTEPIHASIKEYNIQYSIYSAKKDLQCNCFSSMLACGVEHGGRLLAQSLPEARSGVIWCSFCFTSTRGVSDPRGVRISLGYPSHAFPGGHLERKAG